jgi:hypothetical protein
VALFIDVGTANSWALSAATVHIEPRLASRNNSRVVMPTSLAAFANSKESSLSRELEVTAASFQLLQAEMTVRGIRFGIKGLNAEPRITFFFDLSHG